MTLYSPPPPLHTFYQDKPTLLVCWWMTLFCATVILLRVTGRFIRSEKLFKEDKTVLYALVPLFARMALVHLVLLWGTNNAQFNRPLSDKEKMQKSIASGLVIATRMLYAATLWILKLAVLDFFKRLTSTFWKRSHQIILKIIQIVLGLTFFAIFAADLTECRPFNHYWQVLPDPGGECRQGYVQLITMSAANIMTDLILVIYPVPIILTSQMGTKRKFQLTLLFAMSLGPVGTTIFRLIHVLRENGSQQTRSLLASVELLFATTAANALVLGSFVRDRGTKKAKYRVDSFAADTLDRVSSRRPTIRHWGSDEDLVRELGVNVAPEYRDGEDDSEERLGRRVPAPPANAGQWQLNPDLQATDANESTAFLQPGLAPISTNYSNSLITPRRVSFADAGGLLDGDTSSTLRSNRDSYNSSQDPLSPYRSTPSPIMTASGSGLRRGSQTILHDLGGLLQPFQSRRGRSRGRSAANVTELQPIPQHPQEPAYETASFRGGPILVDAGGLLK